MFHSTTHYKHWIFADEEELSLRRVKANESFISECEDKLQANNVRIGAFSAFFSLINSTSFSSWQDNIPYLKVDEEANLVNFYLSILIDFCCKFKPPMPKNVIVSFICCLCDVFVSNLSFL